MVRELKYLRAKPYNWFDTGTFVDCTNEEIAKLNVWLRTWSKIRMQLAEKEICTHFDTLHELTSSINWSDYIAPMQWISIVAHSRESELHAERTIQSISHKAVIQSLTWTDNSERDIDDTIPVAIIRVSIAHDYCKIFINTSWNSLHERWYRLDSWEAPIKEHMAAALVLMTSRWYSTPFVDPYCGSWTIPIEAAMIASNRAPWLKRSFACERFPWFDFTALVAEQKEQAQNKIFDKEYDIQWFDIDQDVVYIAEDNARNAWVDHIVSFRRNDSLHHQFGEEQTIVTNPPYWRRIWEDVADRVHDTLFHKARYVKNMTVISWFEQAQEYYEPRFWKVKEARNWADDVNIYIHKN